MRSTQPAIKSQPFHFHKIYKTALDIAPQFKKIAKNYDFMTSLSDRYKKCTIFNYT